MDDRAEWAQNTSDVPPAIKAHGYVFASDELLMDAGVIPDTRPPSPPPPWGRRMRNRADRWRESLARRAYRIIAGYEVPGAEEW